MRNKIVILFVFGILLFIPNKVLGHTCPAKVTDNGSSNTNIKEIVEWNCEDPEVKNTCEVDFKVEGDEFTALLDCSEVVKDATIYESEKSNCSEFGTGFKLFGKNTKKVDITSSITKYVTKDFSPDKYYLFSFSVEKGVTPYNICVSFGTPTTRAGAAIDPKTKTKTAAISSGTVLNASKTTDGGGGDHPKSETYKTRTIGEPGQICDEDLRKNVRYYWGILMILAPIGLIILITLDFFKAITTDKPDGLQKSASNAVKRAIACVILFMLPFLLELVLSWFGLDMCF